MIPNVGSTQDSPANTLSFEVNRVFPPISLTKQELKAAQTLSELNPYLLDFIKTLKIRAEDYIFPLVKNLNRANCEIIKDILAS